MPDTTTNTPEVVKTPEASSDEQENGEQAQAEIETTAETTGLHADVLASSIESLENSADFMWSVIVDSEYGKNVMKLPDWNEARLEKMAKSIDESIDKYLSPNLDFLDESTKGSIKIWLQLALFKELKTSWKDGQAFFESFSKVKTNATNKNWEIKKKWFFNTFKSLTKTLWVGGGFVSLLQKVDNLKNYLWTKQYEIWDGKNVEILNDPMKFVEFVNNPAFANSKLLATKKPEELWLLKGESDFSKMNLENKWEMWKKIWELVDSLGIEINSKLMESIEKSVSTSTRLLDQRTSIRDNLISGVWGIDALFEWIQQSIWSFIDIPSLEDFLSSDNVVLNLIFSLLGFQWWLKGLRKDHIAENIRKWTEINPERRGFVNKVMKEFLNKNSNETITNSNDIHKQFNNELVALQVLEDEKDESKNQKLLMKSRIPKNYSAVKYSLESQLEKWASNLNYDVISKYGLEQYGTFTAKEIAMKNWEKKTVIDTATITDMDKFLDAYLTQVIPELWNNLKFMNSIQNPESFMFAVAGNLVFDKYFVDWVRLGVENYAVEKKQVEYVENTDEKFSVNLEALKASLNEPQKWNLDTILAEINAQWITDKNHIAYILATVKWESAFKNIKEKGWENKGYWTQDSETKQSYYWRWFVQITHKENYEKFNDLIKKEGRFNNIDIVNNPDEILNNPELAAFILVKGMKDWLFTTKKLDDYNQGNWYDFLSARAIVNWTDKQNEFAQNAQELLA